MRNGTCPKCQSTDVYTSYAKSSLDAGLRDEDQQCLHLHTVKPGIFGDKFSMLYLDFYVCRRCGYVEQYVHEPAELEPLPTTSNWRKVG